MSPKSDRPTMPPAFDVEQFAKESDRRIAVGKQASEDLAPDSSRDTTTSHIRLLTRPEIRAAMTDESWARTMTGVPVVVMGVEDLKRLPLDHRAGFLLSMMDGATDLETLAEIAGMPRDEVVHLLRDLVESGVVNFRTPG
ncbi:MAG TPA: hypothetical protein VGL81_16215 [Polyangiaceae bacterium]|jgi:hypothetical protein